jgi:hypothetical protein
MQTFETRIQDPEQYPMYRLERTAANLAQCVTDAETVAMDPSAARFYAGRLTLVREQIARRLLDSPSMDYRQASTLAGTLTLPVLNAVLDAAGWTVHDTERDDTCVLRGMVTCALYQR